jgi:hypothetical protein
VGVDGAVLLDHNSLLIIASHLYLHTSSPPPKHGQISQNDDPCLKTLYPEAQVVLGFLSDLRTTMTPTEFKAQEDINKNRKARQIALGGFCYSGIYNLADLTQQT